MATDGTLLQGEVSNPTDNPLLDGAFVENLLAGFLKALVTEQLVDMRKEAAPSDITSPSRPPIDIPAQAPEPRTAEKPATTEEGKPHLKFIRGGKAGNA